MTADSAVVSITQARAQFKDIYDAAERRVPSVVQRGGDAAVAVVRRDDLVTALRALCPLDPQVSITQSGVAMWLEGIPVSSDGPDLEAAEVAFVEAMRDYADLWASDLSRFSDHEHLWSLTNLVLLSTDDELRAHLFGDS